MTISDVPPAAELVRRPNRASGVSIELIASLDDLYFQSRLAADDNFEPAVSVALLTLPADGVAIDLGACLGVVSAALGQIAPHGRVLSVEASAALQPGLTQTCAASGAHVTVVNTAVGATVGSATYHAHPQGGAWGYVDEAGGYSVQQTTVDALVQQFGLTRVDFLKIDTEGSELAVMQGAEHTVRAHQPVLVVELNPFCLWRYGRTVPQDVVAWMRERYEHLYSIDHLAAVTPLVDDHGIDSLLCRLGTYGGLVDVVASPRQIDFPTPLWAEPPGPAPSEPAPVVAQPAAPAPRSFLQKVRGRLFPPR